MPSTDLSEPSLRKLASLWEREQETIRQTHRELRETHDLAERVRRGIALEGLRFENAESGPAGRRLLWFHLGREGALEDARIAVGDPIVLWRDDKPLGRYRQAGQRGMVARRGQDRLAVSVDEQPESWVEREPLNLDLEAPETTFERGRTAIGDFLDDPALSRLRDVLFGDEAPRFSESREPPEFRDEGLDESQRSAIQHALGALDIALIHGPPGTGKTRTLAEVVRQALLGGQSVLVTAASHTAVDNLTERLIDNGIKPLRLGHPARVAPAVEARSLDVLVEQTKDYQDAQKLLAQAEGQRGRQNKREPASARAAREATQRRRKLASDARLKLKEARARVVRRSKVVCCTAAGTDSRLLGDNHFDWVILDEATQAPDPIALAALRRGSRAILAGDPHQLSPTITDPEVAREGLASTLFERLAERWSDDATRMLTVQYRMHDELMQFPSHSMYGGRLEAAPGVRDHRLEQLPGVRADAERPKPWHLLDCRRLGWTEEREQGGSSVSNPQQAEQTASEIRRLVDRGVRAEDIAAITPYAAQAQRLRSLLRDPPTEAVEIGTVDGFQGREKEAVVVDLVRSNTEREIGFLADVRRMNVALTRARRFLVVVGDGDTLEGHAYYDAMLEAARQLGARIEL